MDEQAQKQVKNDFSWKRYFIVIIISEIVTILINTIETYHMFTIPENTWPGRLSSGLMIMMIIALNSSIIGIISIIEFIKYKKYKCKGKNKVINIIIAILSSILIAIGVYILNMRIEEILSSLLGGYKIEEVPPIDIIFLGIGIILIFPVFKSKKIQE